MVNINEKIAYLRGLAEGLKLSGDEKLLLSAVVDVLNEVSRAVDSITESVEDIQDDVDDIADSLDELIEDLFDEDAEDGEDDESEGYIELACPKCGRHILFDIESFNADEDHLCSCGAELFTEEEEPQE